MSINQASLSSFKVPTGISINQISESLDHCSIQLERNAKLKCNYYLYLFTVQIESLMCLRVVIYLAQGCPDLEFIPLSDR